MNLELETARQRLAECEAAIAAGLGGPYGKRNLASVRTRVARLETSGVPALAAAPARAPSPVSVASGVVSAKPARPTGSREERLRRLARAMEADERHLAEALAAGTTPDEFALEILDSRDPDAIARRIANSDRPAASMATPEVEAIAERILNA